MDYDGHAPEDFRAFLVARKAASLALVNGDPGPQCSLTAPIGECTFFDPGGGHTVGLERVRDRYRQGASRFVRGTYDFEPVAFGAQGSLGYLCGFQRTSAWLHGGEEPVALDLRVTEVYGRSDDRWVVLHRHAERMPQ